MKNTLTEKEVKSLTELSQARFDLNYDFLKKILTVSVSLFAIIVSLSGVSSIYFHNTTTNHNVYSIYPFVLALSTLSLGIVCVSIGLYGFVAARGHLLNRYLEKVMNRLNGDDRKYTILSGTDPDKRNGYNYATWIGLFSLVLSVVSFTIYLILLTFNY